MTKKKSAFRDLIFNIIFWSVLSGSSLWMGWTTSSIIKLKRNEESMINYIEAQGTVIDMLLEMEGIDLEREFERKIRPKKVPENEI